MNNYEKKGHPILGIVLAVIGIMVALVLTLLTGVIGGAVAGVLGLVALLLGVFAVKGGKKLGGIVSILAGVMAVILAVTMTLGTISVLDDAKKKAQNNPDTPMVAKYLDNTSLGLMGILLKIPKNEGEATADLEALKKELDILKAVDETAATATEAPAAEEAPAEEAPAAEEAAQ